MYLQEALHKYNEASNYMPTITSANDSKHMEGFYHYKDYAWDIRTKDHSNPQELASWLQKELGHGYEVILEKDHIRIEPSEAYVSSL